MHHCYLPQYRFSEDLDFTSLLSNLSLTSVKQVLTEGDLFEVRKEYESPATVKFERLWYPGILDQPGPSRSKSTGYKTWFYRPKIYRTITSGASMFPSKSWTSGKSVRKKSEPPANEPGIRDFYDLYFILTTYQFDLIEIHSLIQRKEVRSPITHEAMLPTGKLPRVARQMICAQSTAPNR